MQKVEECGECIPEINEPGFGNMDDFLERYLHSGGMIYKDDEEEPSETTPSSNAPMPLTVTTSSQTESSRTILEDFEKTRQEIEPATVRRSTRDRKSTPKMALFLRQTEFRCNEVVRKLCVLQRVFILLCRNFRHKLLLFCL